MKKLNIIDKLHIYTIKNVPVALQTKKIYTGTTVKVIGTGEFRKKYTKHEDRLLYGIHKEINLYQKIENLYNRLEYGISKEQQSNFYKNFKNLYKLYIDLETNEVIEADNVDKNTLINLNHSNRLVRRKNLIKNYKNVNSKE